MKKTAIRKIDKDDVWPVWQEYLKEWGGEMSNKKYMAEAKRAVKSGRWMVRTDNDGEAYNGFKWKPQGQWTVAPDWNTRAECGGGLHGQARQASGYNGGKPRLVFCRTKGRRVKIGIDKIKVREAKILLIDELPPNLKFDGDLDLNGSGIKKIGKGLSVGGYLDLQGTEITSLPDNLSVGRFLYLQGTKITSLPKNLSVRGYLYLRGTKITSLPDNLSVIGSLYLGGTNIKKEGVPKKLRKKCVW